VASRCIKAFISMRSLVLSDPEPYAWRRRKNTNFSVSDLLSNSMDCIVRNSATMVALKRQMINADFLVSYETAITTFIRSFKALNAFVSMFMLINISKRPRSIPLLSQSSEYVCVFTRLTLEKFDSGACWWQWFELFGV